jgi:hypothetical protein
VRDQDEAAVIILVLQGEDLGALADLGLRCSGILVDDPADLGVVSEAVRVVTGIPEAWQLERPVGKPEIAANPSARYATAALSARARG